jgi:quercetin dioxygenase-like cupin family protein
VSGKAIQGGVSRKITKGDRVIIPAGTTHWFSEIQQDIVYTVVRVDPARVVTLK